MFRFGGTSLAFRGTQVASAAEDVFAEIHGGKVSGKVETLPPDVPSSRYVCRRRRQPDRTEPNTREIRRDH